MYDASRVVFQVARFSNIVRMNQWLKDHNDVVWSVKLMTETNHHITLLVEYSKR